LRGVALYLALMTVVAVVMGVVLARLGPRPAAFALVYAYMLTPALACILVRLLRREGFVDAGLRLGPPSPAETPRARRAWRAARWYGLAWLIGVGGTLAVYLVLWAIGEARFDLSWDRVMALAPPGSAESEPPAWLGEQRFM